MDHEPATDEKPEGEKSVRPSLSHDDIKLLVLTFVGTVAANVVTVIFVGLAIAAAHVFRSDLANPGWTDILMVPLVIIMGITWPIAVFTKRIVGEDRIVTAVLVGMAILAMFFALYFVMALIGIAAGTK